MIAGTLYGTVLNDTEQLGELADSLTAAPYNAPPRVPVLYIKSRNCLMVDAAGVRLDDDVAEVEIAATIGLLFGRDACRVTRDAALSHVAAACLALDISLPNASYYRPSVRQRCRDGFLPLGALTPFDPAHLTAPIETRINGHVSHTWSLDRLHRDAATLIADISAFMTLAAGDLLLLGLPGDAPRARAGDRISLRAGALPVLTTQICQETKA